MRGSWSLSYCVGSLFCNAFLSLVFLFLLVIPRSCSLTVLLSAVSLSLFPIGSTLILLAQQLHFRLTVSFPHSTRSRYFLPSRILHLNEAQGDRQVYAQRPCRKRRRTNMIHDFGVPSKNYY